MVDTRQLYISSKLIAKNLVARGGWWADLEQKQVTIGDGQGGNPFTFTASTAAAVGSTRVLISCAEPLQLLLPATNLPGNKQHTSDDASSTTRRYFYNRVWFTERAGIVFHCDLSRRFVGVGI